MGFGDALFIMAFIVLPVVVVGWGIATLRSLPPSPPILPGRRPARSRAARRSRASSAVGLDVTNEPAPAPRSASPTSRRPRPMVHPGDPEEAERWMPPSGSRQPTTGDRNRSWGGGSELTPPTA